MAAVLYDPAPAALKSEVGERLALDAGASTGDGFFVERRAEFA